MEHKANTPGVLSSKPNSSKLSTAHIVVSSFAALAGVGLAAYQVLAPAPAPQQQPVTVTLALEPQQAGADTVVTKSNAETSIQTASVDLDGNATFTAALKDGSQQRYDFGQIFDHNPQTYLTAMAPDTEFNIVVSFNTAEPQAVTAIEYQPPAGIDSGKLAIVADVMVLPEGQLEFSGRPVMSFSLQTSPGSQTFAIPGHALGKGLWLRIAGPAGVGGFAIGDFRILREHVGQ